MNRLTYERKLNGQFNLSVKSNKVRKLQFFIYFGLCGSTNEKKKSKLPIMIGAVVAVAFVLIIAYVFVAIFLANRRRARLPALVLPTSTVTNLGIGASPLYGQQMGNDSNQPTFDADMG
ncbi:hypothetical protein EUTSA_v10002730mg [Eutrema salsugineum]|uniref:Uncharacterized protein n=1 Tax=Eutrema salsugineum TaxID=72664 RepID=V4L4Z8_EUTSA|nr:hypothetical protein EUTSA_v10002730mg [Eutrema salsugineum]